MLNREKRSDYPPSKNRLADPIQQDNGFHDYSPPPRATDYPPPSKYSDCHPSKIRLPDPPLIDKNYRPPAQKLPPINHTPLVPGPIQNEPSKELTLQEQFEEFHEKHPDVYNLFRQFASDLRKTGKESYGAKSIMERIRWHYATTSVNETFKINNNYTSRYARKLMSDQPEYKDFFETRQLQRT